MNSFTWSFFVLIGLLFSQAHAQNLLKERIWKIEGRKKSIFLEQGVFHSGTSRKKTVLKSVRHFFSKKNGQERVVFDFSTNPIPKIYGHISQNGKKLYIDLFDTGIKDNVPSVGTSKFVKEVKFYPISNESLSVELDLKSSSKFDIFYLENHARLVIDIREKF